MAKESGKDQSLDEIKQRIDRSRYDLGRDVSGLRYELDIPLKIRKSFQRNTVLWVTGAVIVGLMFTAGPRRKKKIYVDAKGKKKAKETIVEAGLLLTTLKFAASVLKPIVVSYAMQKMKGVSGVSRSNQKW
jgi:predicted cation transporter